MSFNFNNNINIPHTPNPQIQKTGDGHAGNSGYCPQKKKDNSKEEEADKFESSIFDDKKNLTSSLEFLDEKDSVAEQLIKKLKNFFK